ncbi:activator of 90 kDa heat shock protein ATPase [Ceratobasidium sp. AG-Ba]|nr:activator of 90 kDa heat shock protein ATPase [Ceratobasidium sp. AG-Ba]QRW01790.1 activator of 90 kDa heat shock protein ATPase [Ceratobasidium sp. AG-Ba]
MSMPASTANWHWKNKNVTPWAKTWFETELTTLSHTEDGSEVKFTQVTEVDGDCELGQRKSKLITIYDCKVVLSWSGEDKEGTKAEGSLTIPEVSHEQSDGLSDYVYQWSLSSSSSPAVNALYTLAKSKLPSLLEQRLSTFRTAMLDTHGKDLTVTGTPNTTTPGTPAPAPSGTPLSKPVPAKEVVKGITNATTVTVDASFMAPADDLFELLTDEKKIPAWSHAPAQSEPTVGGAVSMFGGGVTGKYTELQKPTKIVSTWKLDSPNWPAGHEGQLTITLNQQSDSTKTEFKLSGVPRGMEDETRKNLEGYYIRGFQSIGYVRIFPAPTSQPSSAHVKRQPNGTSPSWVIPCVFAFLAFSATIASRYL